MDKENYEIIIESLLDKIVKLQSDIWHKDFEIRSLKEDNEKLNELLNPTKKVGEEDE